MNAPTLALSGKTILIGKDFADAVSGKPATHGGATINGNEYSVRSTLRCSDTSDALIRAARREGATMQAHWTQAACPKCGSDDLDVTKHAATFALPECSTAECAECGFVSEPT